MRHIWPDDQIAELGAARSHAHNALLRLHHRRSQGPARLGALDSALVMDGTDHIRLCDVGLAAEAGDRSKSYHRRRVRPAAPWS